MVAALTVVAAPAYAQTGEVTNSKYLEIIEHRYRVGEFSDTITGTVNNISTEEVSSITIYLLLYYKANQLITIETGYADVTPLPSQDTILILHYLNPISNTSLSADESGASADDLEYNPVLWKVIEMLKQEFGYSIDNIAVNGLGSRDNPDRLYVVMTKQ